MLKDRERREKVVWVVKRDRERERGRIREREGETK